MPGSTSFPASEGRSWRADPIRDADEVVYWMPVIRVSSASETWAGLAEDGRWVVGLPGCHVLWAGSQPGAVALLPLLERPVAEVASELGVEGLDGHGLGFANVVSAALGWRGSIYWAEKAIAWLDAGFPAAGHEDSLRRLLAEKRVGQRARQMAARVLAGCS